jgi:sulfide:quinone oxidoreductase
MKKHVLILGAGFGGLELATRLSETLQDAVRVTLLDRNDSFVFGFSKLESMLGRQSADEIRLHYRDFDKDGVEFRQETVTGIDPARRRVTTDAGSYDADFLVVAMGADYDMDATPGLEAGGFEYYTVAGAERLRDALADFDGGRVLVSVLGQPFKCPPAPFEGRVPVARVLHAAGHPRVGADDVDVPDAAPVPVTGRSRRCSATRSPAGHRGAAPAPRHEHRAGDAYGTACRRWDAALRPVRRHPDPPRARSAAASGLAVNGWVPVDQTNLRTQFPQVYALGDVCTGARTVPEGRDLRRVGRTRRGRRHRGRRSPAGSHRSRTEVGRLLRRVRRRARQQGRGQLPQRTGRRRRSATTRRASTPPRRRSSARPGERAGSGSR